MVLGKQAGEVHPCPHSAAAAGCVTIMLFFLLLLMLAMPCLTQRQDQTYIVIHPRRLIISKDKPTGEVKVRCRQLPYNNETYRADSLTIARQLGTGILARPQELARVSGDNNAPTVRNLTDIESEAEGHASTELVLILREVTCQHASYTYVCYSKIASRDSSLEERNVASDSFKVKVPRPSVRFGASPNHHTYQSSQNVTLRCTTADPVAVAQDTPRWVWEYSDGGPWQAVALNDKDDFKTENCFKMTQISSLTVPIRDVNACRRIYRCFVALGAEDGQRQLEAERRVNKGDLCDESYVGPSPVLAILVVVFTVVGLLGFLVLLSTSSGELRKQAKEYRERQLRFMILSPMTPEQRAKHEEAKSRNPYVPTYYSHHEPMRHNPRRVSVNPQMFKAHLAAFKGRSRKLVSHSDSPMRERSSDRKVSGKLRRKRSSGSISKGRRSSDTPSKDRRSSDTPSKGGKWDPPSKGGKWDPPSKGGKSWDPPSKGGKSWDPPSKGGKSWDPPSKGGKSWDIISDSGNSSDTTSKGRRPSDTPKGRISSDTPKGRKSSDTTSKGRRPSSSGRRGSTSLHIVLNTKKSRSDTSLASTTSGASTSTGVSD